MVIGGKGLKDGVIEVKWRNEADARKIPVATAVSAILELLTARKAEEAAKAPA